MGYFSNGTEGASYEEQYCSTCQHGGPGGTCSVWLAHLMHAYSESGTKSAAEQILETLIPRSEPIGNGKCTMHLPIVRKPRRRKT